MIAVFDLMIMAVCVALGAACMKAHEESKRKAIRHEKAKNAQLRKENEQLRIQSAVAEALASQYSNASEAAPLPLVFGEQEAEELHRNGGFVRTNFMTGA